MFGGPKGIRTPVTDVRGQRPRPLDDGTVKNDHPLENSGWLLRFIQKLILFNLNLTKKQRQIQVLEILGRIFRV